MVARPVRFDGGSGADADAVAVCAAAFVPFGFDLPSAVKALDLPDLRIAGLSTGSVGDSGEIDTAARVEFETQTSVVGTGDLELDVDADEVAVVGGGEGSVGYR